MSMIIGGICGLLLSLSIIAITAVGYVAIESYYQMRGDGK